MSVAKTPPPVEAGPVRRFFVSGDSDFNGDEFNCPNSCAGRVADASRVDGVVVVVVVVRLFTHIVPGTILLVF